MRVKLENQKCKGRYFELSANKKTKQTTKEMKNHPTIESNSLRSKIYFCSTFTVVLLNIKDYYAATNSACTF